MGRRARKQRHWVHDAVLCVVVGVVAAIVAHKVAQQGRHRPEKKAGRVEDPSGPLTAQRVLRILQDASKADELKGMTPLDNTGRRQQEYVAEAGRLMMEARRLSATSPQKTASAYLKALNYDPSREDIRHELYNRAYAHMYGPKQRRAGAVDNITAQFHLKAKKHLSRSAVVIGGREYVFYSVEFPPYDVCS